MGCGGGMEEEAVNKPISKAAHTMDMLGKYFKADVLNMFKE